MSESQPETVNEQLIKEARELTARIDAQTDQVDRLRSLAAKIEQKTDEDREALRDLEGVLGESSQLRIDDLDKRLGGQRLERVAIRLLRDRPDIEEIHYREWFDLIREAGYKVSGQNPLGTFLAQLNRSEAVERVGHRSGRYKLRLAS